MEPKELFLNILLDIEKKLLTNNYYEKFKIAQLLRQLLLDSKPLLHEVNKVKKRKITFTINDYVIPVEYGSAWGIVSGFDPAKSSDGTNINKVSLDGLLSVTVLLIDPYAYSVKELISIVANKLGAVHLDFPLSENDIKNETDQKVYKLFDLLSKTRVNDIPIYIETICSVSRVVLTGLDPIRADLELELGQERKIGLDEVLVDSRKGFKISNVNMGILEEQ